MYGGGALCGRRVLIELETGTALTKTGGLGTDTKVLETRFDGITLRRVTVWYTTLEGVVVLGLEGEEEVGNKNVGPIIMG